MFAQRSAAITVNLDYGQMGVGGNDTWSTKARPHPTYRLRESSYPYGFVLRPFDAGRQGPKEAAATPLPEQASLSSSTP